MRYAVVGVKKETGRLVRHIIEVENNEAAFAMAGQLGLSAPKISAIEADGSTIELPSGPAEIMNRCAANALALSVGMMLPVAFYAMLIVLSGPLDPRSIPIIVLMLLVMSTPSIVLLIFRSGVKQAQRWAAIALIVLNVLLAVLFAFILFLEGLAFALGGFNGAVAFSTLFTLVYLLAAVYGVIASYKAMKAIESLSVKSFGFEVQPLR